MVRSIRIALAVLLAAAFIVVPIWSLIDPGPFQWHVEQPAFRQGGFELLVVGALVFLAMCLRDRRIGAGLAIVVSALYARRHGVDVSIALALLYAEGLFAIGWRLLRPVGLRETLRPPEMFVAGLLGIVAWSLLIWSLAAVGVGELQVVRILAVIVLGLALLFRRGPLLSVVLARRASRGPLMARGAWALVIATTLMMFAKASVVIDYDSMWYGLQIDEMLVGAGGLYEPEGLASLVHYYPKLFDALLLPVSGLDSVSMPFGITIAAWLMLVITASAILRELGVDRASRACVAAVLGTLPAVANIAVSAKGDIFSAWMMLVAVLGLVRFSRHKGSAWWWLAISAISLGTLARLSTLPYAAVFAVFAIALPIQMAASRTLPAAKLQGIWIAILSGILTAFVLARSVLLAGVFFVAPEGVVKLQEAAGMTLKYPVGRMPPESGLERVAFPRGLGELLFEPHAFPHLLFSWTGNAWLWLVLALAILGLFRWPRGRIAWMILAVGSMFFALEFGYPLPALGGDGNYFIVPLACLLLWGAMCARPARDAKAAQWWRGGLLAFAFAGAAISLVTGSWGPGTRPLSMQWHRMPFEMREHARYYIETEHMQGLAEFFARKAPATRVVGLEKSLDSLPVAWWLNVRYEALQPYAWQQSDIVRSADTLRDYFVREGIAYVIEPKQALEGRVVELWHSARDRMAADGLARVAWQDANWRVWEIDRVVEFRAPMRGGGFAQVTVPKETLCAGNVVAKLAWSTPANSIAVEVQSATAPHAQLFAEGGVRGTAETGPWVANHSRFFFRAGRAGALLATVPIAYDCAED